MLFYLGAGLGIAWCVELAGYVCLTPALPVKPVRAWVGWNWLGLGAFYIAYGLSLLRAPLGLVPYLVKLGMHFGLRWRYEARRTTYVREVVNLLAELANVLLTWGLVWWLVGPLRLQWWVLVCYLPLWAEALRLLAERVPIIFSAAWQLLPHRAIAYYLQRRRSYRPGSIGGRYCCYYSLSDEERAALVLEVLKQRVAADGEVAQRLAYMQAFRIIPQQQALRGGLVRDVARGEVFVHGIWTNDPWLLSGMALRRAPWSFDPRYVARPFYYMSGSNRAMSRFVLRNARYSLPYALFQFGHEIRVARLHFFYTLLRWLGADIERTVWDDGTFQNDQCIYWLKQRLGWDPGLAERRPLYADAEVLAELATGGEAEGSEPIAQQVAERYIYPLSYVEEVLLPQYRKQKEAVHAQFPSPA
ncbi:hypothetical protein [Dictyobacter kobayashii]|nr:hypothetical protein [Dictyobacter kobayashii]